MARNLRVDISWNIISFAIMGTSGILLNVLIGRYYDSSTLGIFNQVLALYIFFSQFSTFGIHYSSLKYVAEYSTDRGPLTDIISSAILLTTGTSALICLIGYFSSFFLGALYSDNVVSGWLLALPGLFFFPINKVLLSVANGLRYMVFFAVIQSLRYMLMLGCAVTFIALGKSGDWIPLVLTVTEGIIFVLLIGYTFPFIQLKNMKKTVEWTKNHFHFGKNSFLAGAITELNSKVDILMLGALTSDQLVGVYSMAALIAEGVAQLTVAIRNNLNPLITQFWRDQQYQKLEGLLLKTRKKLYIAMTGIGAIAIFVYPIFVKLFLVNQDFLVGWTAFGILIAGLVSLSGYAPMNMIFLQVGRPAVHTQYLLGVVAINAVGNAILIPFLGIHGAAAATALSLLASAALLKYLMRSILNLSI